jgi:hypothetical protein
LKRSRCFCQASSRARRAAFKAIPKAQVRIAEAPRKFSIASQAHSAKSEKASPAASSSPRSARK